MRLIVLHYHYRPGGVRRVIESALPFLLRALPAIDRVILAGGEAHDVPWNLALEKSLGPVPVEFFVEPAFGYVSEQRDVSKIEARVRSSIIRLMAGGEALLWAHNFGIARNLPLARACAESGVKMIVHHHDWWFDQRWLRWPEMQCTGFRTLGEIARALFPEARFAAINRTDAAVLKKHFGKRCAWLPNPSPRAPQPPPARVRRARKWLHERLGEDAPVWLMPCRILRRKNIAEALLLTRWLRPEAMLATTGGASSADEQFYAETLAAAARKHGWRLRIGLLQGASSAPSLPELLAASECLLLTSIQEGFGLAALEAAAAGRPLLTRRLPNIAPDLRRFGFRFPHAYREVFIAPDAFDWEAERVRQKALFRKWQSTLPRKCRAWSERPELPRGAVPFSGLTLTAQVEVLSLSSADSWARCARWNPLLRAWKTRAASGSLQPTPWPAQADEGLGGAAFARRFATLAGRRTRPVFHSVKASAALEEFIRLKLKSAHLFPLLFARES